MSYHTLHAKAESAGVLWTTSKNVGTTQIYSGKRAIDMEGQRVVIYAEKSKEDPVGSSNFRLLLKIMVRTPIGEEPDAVSHDALVGKVFDAWRTEHDTNPNYFAEQLSELVENFTVFGFFTPETGLESGHDENSAWQDELVIGLYCCPSDID